MQLVIFNVMKRLNYILLAVLAMAFCSCSNDVELYNDKGDSTVVYFMLDTGADTNFAKITKSFAGDATILAQDYDACNYKVGELDVYMLKKKDTILMRPVQKWLPYDPSSIFYSGCYQTYYYTDEKLISGVNYKLIINRNDGVVVSAEAKTIDDFNFMIPNPDQEVNFNTNATPQIKWKNGNPNSMESNAALFEVVAYFRYEELQPGATEWVDKEIRWKLGSDESEKLFNSKYNYYYMSYTPKVLFDILKNDKYLVENSPAGVQRKIKKMRIDITGIGDEYYNYLLINNSSSAIQDTPNYTNIENGVGLMSSRVTRSQKIIINQPSRQKIDEMFPEYGFDYDPNSPTD